MAQAVGLPEGFGGRCQPPSLCGQFFRNIFGAGNVTDGAFGLGGGLDDQFFVVAEAFQPSLDVGSGIFDGPVFDAAMSAKIGGSDFGNQFFAGVFGTAEFYFLNAWAVQAVFGAARVRAFMPERPVKFFLADEVFGRRHFDNIAGRNVAGFVAIVDDFRAVGVLDEKLLGGLDWVEIELMKYRQLRDILGRNAGGLFEVVDAVHPHERNFLIISGFEEFPEDHGGWNFMRTDTAVKFGDLAGRQPEWSAVSAQAQQDTIDPLIGFLTDHIAMGPFGRVPGTLPWNNAVFEFSDNPVGNVLVDIAG